MKKLLDPVSYATNVAKETDVETLKILLDKGFGFGEIGYITYLSTISGKSVEELADVVDYDEKGLGNILNELDVD